MHAYIYRTLQSHPGVSVLHEYVLHNLVIYLTLGQGDAGGYVAALADAYGDAGWQAGREVIETGAVPDYAKNPLPHGAIRASTGVVVHSRYLHNRIRFEHPGIPVARIPHFSFSLAPDSESAPNPARARQRLGLTANQLLIGSFGFVVATKRIDVALRAFREVHRLRPDARYLIAGPVEPGVDLEGWINELGLNEVVLRTGGVSESEFLDSLAATDICLNLRFPTGGETSGALIRILGMGKAAIISRVGSFVEIPDAACLKVRPGPSEITDLIAAILVLGADPDWRRRMGEVALAWIAREHRPEDAARRYLDFLGSVGSNRAHRPRLTAADRYTEPLADSLLDLGLDRLSSSALEALAAPVADLL